MRIYLIGMPGSGKTTVGKELAQKLGYKFIDLDAYIELENSMFIDYIFETYGEAKFRELESKALSEVLDENCVISTGGGIVTVKSNKELMNGIKIYINTDVEIIKERLENSYLRPLLKAQSLENIYDKRFLKYQHFADIIISNNEKTSKTVDSIINKLKEVKK